MKQIYKAEGPYRSDCGKSYDAKNIPTSERPPKSWSTELSKVLGKASKPAPAPVSEPVIATDSAVETE